MRLALLLGRPFGVIFVPELNVQVIRRMGRYQGVVGPGLQRYNPWVETLGPLVPINNQKREELFEGLITHDVVPINVRLNLFFSYDPRRAPELAPSLTRFTADQLWGLTRIYLEWTLLASVNQFEAAQITQHAIRSQIETEVGNRLKSEMAVFGIEPRIPVRILRVEMPPSLSERHERIAQRRASVLAGTEFHPAEFRRALVTEFLEHLATTGAGESIINLNEMLESYAAEHRPGKPSGQVIDNPPQSTLRPDPNAPPPTRPRPRL
jgi:hypothetical protein